jgi:hypothetical protein
LGRFDKLERADRRVEFPERLVGRETGLASPWALWVHGPDLYIAMAGPHQIWKMPLDESEIGPYAGNGREDIVDGPLLPKRPYMLGYASFAQPSGLASDGKWLYVADSEGSSIRAVPFDPKLEVETVVGTNHLSEGRLFEFGDEDGEGENIQLQHVLGVTHVDGCSTSPTRTTTNKVVDIRKSAKTLAARKAARKTTRRHSTNRRASLRGRQALRPTPKPRDPHDRLKNGNRVATLTIDGLKPPAPPKQTSGAELGGTVVKIESATVRPVKTRRQNVARLPVRPASSGLESQRARPTGYYIKATAQSARRSRRGSALVLLDKPAAEFDIDLPPLPRRVRRTGQRPNQVLVTPTTAKKAKADLQNRESGLRCR